MSTKEREDLVSRRAELLAELFLQDLHPAYLGRAELTNAPYDYFFGFPSQRGGINTFAVEVKATENFSGSSYPVPKNLVEYLAGSNIPVLLLVADAKNNKLYYGWGESVAETSGTGTDAADPVHIPLTLVDEQTLPSLKLRLAA